MKLAPVKSSNIKAIGHEGDRLRVQFHSGAVWEYDGVGARHHADLMAAKSVGAHFATNIRERFKGRRIDK